MKRVYLSLGSNLGDRKKYLMEAIEKIRQLRESIILRISKIYETPPWGEVDQAAFLNLCLEIETALQPDELLSELQRIELELGRKRIYRWGPRTLDIDILLYEGIESDADHLTLPHPRMTERAFVLVPLQEIAPELLIGGKDIPQMLKILDTEQIKEYTGS